MCGFGGELRFDGRAADAEAVRRMLPCLADRGPGRRGLLVERARSRSATAG